MDYYGELVEKAKHNPNYGVELYELFREKETMVLGYLMSIMWQAGEGTQTWDRLAAEQDAIYEQQAGTAVDDHARQAELLRAWDARIAQLKDAR